VTVPIRSASRSYIPCDELAQEISRGIFAAAPQFTLVFVAEILDGLTAAIVPLAIAAINLGLVGRRAMSSRTGRNYRFAAMGIVFTAVAQGLIGSYFAKNGIFFVTAGLCAAALLPLFVELFKVPTVVMVITGRLG
jgi:hypothetical protein